MTHRYALRALLAAFLCLTTLVSSACEHTPTPEEREAARGRYQIALSLIHDARRAALAGQSTKSDGAWRQALGELLAGIELDDENPELHYLLGMTYFLGFKRHDEAEAHLKRALKLKEDDYPEADNLLGTVLVDAGRPADAIVYLDRARQNLLYATPYFAEQELGWAYFKLEEFDKAERHLVNAVVANPDLCGAYVRLADVQDAQQDYPATQKALTQFIQRCDTERLRAQCGPRLLSYAYFRQGMSAIKLKDAAGAAFHLTMCRDRFPDEPVADECARSLVLLPPEVQAEAEAAVAAAAEARARAAQEAAQNADGTSSSSN